MKRITHGLFLDSSGKKSRLYHIWEDMKSRCLNPNNRRFHRYGGRGITVCDDWQGDYRTFHKWALENGYAENLTIDRKEIDGNYCPENCKWSTSKEQGNNRSTNIMITYNGRTLTRQQWCDTLGFDSHVLKNRLKRGWTVEKAFTTPTDKKIKNEA